MTSSTFDDDKRTKRFTFTGPAVDKDNEWAMMNMGSAEVDEGLGALQLLAELRDVARPGGCNEISLEHTAYLVGLCARAAAQLSARRGWPNSASEWWSKYGHLVAELDATGTAEFPLEACITLKKDEVNGGS